MSSLFDRIANLTKASLHEVLNKMEDPVLMTGQYLRNLEEDIDTAEKMIKEQQIAATVQERKSADIAHLAKQCEVRALTALENGDEVTARHAAAEKIRYEEQAQHYANEAKEAHDRVAELEVRLAEGKAEYARLKEKRNELAARARKAQVKSETKRPNFSYGIESGDAARGFERMEEKILDWETRQEVAGSATHYGSAGSASGDATQSAAVNEELERLKEQLSSRHS
ncbi:PspA/IM30 family protein [Paenibacillus sanguinis]|uniref:PspA/IM30 family protein n=1 Tax=Paenibacillus sanguinis TaxID=225906 RepID=UPI000365F712|nr:PspA/IM30 family protein [Paenibacillus sanguinis]